jgi:hypothetical protein
MELCIPIDGMHELEQGTSEQAFGSSRFHLRHPYGIGEGTRSI